MWRSVRYSLVNIALATILDDDQQAIQDIVTDAHQNFTYDIESVVLAM